MLKTIEGPYLYMTYKLQNLAENAERASKVLGVLANAKRLVVVCNLIKKERSAGELALITNLSYSAVSQHLSKLRTLGMVSCTKSGKEVIYKIHDANVKKILEVLYKIYCK